MLPFMKFIAGAMCAALLAAVPGRADMPTPNVELVQAFLAAFNASSAQQLQDFARAHFSTEALADQPPEQLARRYMMRRKQTGALAYREPGAQTPDRSEFLTENPDHKWFRILLERNAGASTVSDITIDPTISPPREMTHPKTPSDLVRATDAYLRQLVQSGEFSGTVLVSRDGKPILARSAGDANIASHIANTIDTQFNIGSIGKIFTQVAVLQLMQSGKLHATDTIGQWLPDYPNAEAAHSVTLLQLLTMRSGIGDFFGPEFRSGPHGRIRSLEDYLPYFAAKPLAFKPGTSEMYSNGGYLVLGLIVQKASGESYYDYVRANEFVPSGMRHTGYPTTQEVGPKRAVEYTQTPNGLRDTASEAPGRGSSAGGAYSTADDLRKFSAALRSNVFLNAEYTRWLLRRFPDSGPGSDVSPPGNDVLGIAGGLPGANAVLLSDDRGNSVVVLANLDPPAAEALGRQIWRWSVETTPE